MLSATLAFAVDDDQRRKSRNKYLTHIVASGETLYSISKLYGVSINDIKVSNPTIGDDNNINMGQLIRIDAASLIAASASGQPAITEPEPIAKQEPIAETQVKTIEQANQQGYIEHVVKKRETLYGLSRKYNVSILDINSANPSLRSEGLKEGNIILIPSDQATALATTAAVEQEVDIPTKQQLYMQSEQQNQLTEYQYMPQNVPNKHFGVNEPINAAILLPIQVSEKQNRQFAEFYQGLLIATDSIAKDGVSINLNIYNTDKDLSKVESLVSSGLLDDSDIIIGPIYNDQFSIIASYAAQRAIPVVSPLAAVDTDLPNIYQIAPSESDRYAKIEELVKDKHVIIYSSDSDDKTLIDELKIYAPEATIMPFDNMVKPEEIGEQMSSEEENIFVVAATKDQDIDMLLSKLTSVKATNYNKSMSVLGSSSFARSSVDRSNYFRLDVKYISPYHIDRSDSDVLDFDRRYIAKYNRQPSLFAYRGHDVALIFFNMMMSYGSNFSDYMDGHIAEILRTRYSFKRDEDGGKVSNREFMLVNYTPLYNIIVK